MKKLLILFALCLTPLLTRAEQIHPLEFKYDICGSYTVLHINGVATSLDGAKANRDAIAMAYGNAHAGHRVTYGLAYNQTRGLIMDVHQAYQQVLFSFPGITYGDWLGHVLNAILPKWITDSVIGQISAKLKPLLVWRKPDVFFDSDLSYQLSQAKSLGFLVSGSRMTIVGHSHGTIYANIMYRYLTGGWNAAYKMEPQQVKLMSIAAFVPKIEGTGGMYVTNRNDNPVNSGRVLYSDVLAGTVTIPHTEPSTYVWRGHNLINKYLADVNSKKAIVDNMKIVMDRLQSGKGFVPPTRWATLPFNEVTYMPCPVGPTCTGPWWINGVYTTMTMPFYWWYIPNGGPPPNSDAAVSGSRSAALMQSTANAKACYAATIAAVLPLKKAGINQWPYLEGCWAFDPQTHWWVYSGEGPPVWKSEFDIPPYTDAANGYAAPTCKAVI